MNRRDAEDAEKCRGGSQNPHPSTAEGRRTRAIPAKLGRSEQRPYGGVA